MCSSDLTAFDHVGIGDPQIAPSDTFEVVWAHYGMTAEALTQRILRAADAR